MVELATSFMLVFGSLFPIVNPPGGALLFLALTRSADRRQRAWLAARIAVYGFFIIAASMFGGAWFLGFFGVSVPALQVGGGLVIGIAGWRLLNSKEMFGVAEIGTADTDGLETSAFFPLTMPLTTGPGTIAVTIALGTSPSIGTLGSAMGTFGALTAAMAISGLIYICYRFADRLETLLGRALTDALMRMFALLLLCVGIEIMWAGLQAMIRGSRLLG